MKQEVFKLLDAFNREGWDNGIFGFVEDVNTKEYFGSKEVIELKGHWLYFFRYDDIAVSFVDNREYNPIAPQHTLHMDDDTDIVELYPLD